MSTLLLLLLTAVVGCCLGAEKFELLQACLEGQPCNCPDGSSICISEAAHQQFRRVQKVFLVAPVGDSRVGKSFFNNMIVLGKQAESDIRADPDLSSVSHWPFPVGDGGSSSPTTHGVSCYGPIYAAQLAKSHGLPSPAAELDKVAIFLVDTEGLGVLEDEQSTTIKLVAPAFAISHSRMLLWQGVPRGPTLDKLTGVLRLVSLAARKIHDLAPRLSLIARDALSTSNTEQIAKASVKAVNDIQDFLTKNSPADAELLGDSLFSVALQPGVHAFSAAYFHTVAELVKQLLADVQRFHAQGSLYAAEDVVPLLREYTKLFKNAVPDQVPPFSDIWSAVARQHLARLVDTLVHEFEPQIASNVSGISALRLYEIERVAAIEFFVDSATTLLRQRSPDTHAPIDTMNAAIKDLSERIKQLWLTHLDKAMKLGAQPEGFLGRSFNSHTGRMNGQLLSFVTKTLPLAERTVNVKASGRHTVAVLDVPVGVDVVLMERKTTSESLSSATTKRTITADNADNSIFGSSTGFNPSELASVVAPELDLLANFTKTMSLSTSTNAVDAFFGTRLEAHSSGDKLQISRSVHEVARVSLSVGFQFTITDAIQGLIVRLKAQGLYLSCNNDVCGLLSDKARSLAFSFFDEIGDIVLSSYNLGWGNVTTTVQHSADAQRKATQSQSSSSKDTASASFLGLHLGSNRAADQKSNHTDESSPAEHKDTRNSIEEAFGDIPSALLHSHTPSFTPITKFIQDAEVSAALMHALPLWRMQFIHPQFPSELKEIGRFVPNTVATLFVNGELDKPYSVLLGATPDSPVELQGVSVTGKSPFHKGAHDSELWETTAELQPTSLDGEYLHIYIDPSTMEIFGASKVLGRDGTPLQLGELACARKCRWPNDKEDWRDGTKDISLANTPFKFDTIATSFSGDIQYLTPTFLAGDKVLKMQMHKQVGRGEGRTKWFQCETVHGNLVVKYAK